MTNLPVLGIFLKYRVGFVGNRTVSLAYETIFPLVGSLNPLMIVTKLCIGSSIPSYIICYYFGFQGIILPLIL